MKSENNIPEYTLRLCSSLADFDACVQMQREVWQFSDLDISPIRALVITQHSGGFTLGAFDPAGRMLGFSHALPAFDDRNRPYFYSHMLAVTPSLQNSGIGAKLKLAQREHALQHKIPLMVWTFDPLQSRNAYLNIIKLGGVVRRYHENYYGNFSTSALHAGLDTDRLLIEWWVGSDHVRQSLAGSPRTSPPVATAEVPFDIQQIKERDLQQAREWQLQIRAAFQQHFAEGLYCAGFERGINGGHSRYLFFRDERQEIPPNY
jgi:predicted GNAT superfamily acetyltransferase